VSDERDQVLALASQLRVLVIGDATFECTLAGSSDRLCREAPVPIVDIKATHCLPLGAAAVASEIAAAGAHVTLLSAIGDDDDGELFHGILQGAGVDPSLAVEPGRRITARHRVVAGSQILLRFDQTTSTPLDAGTETALLRSLKERIRDADAIVLAEPFRDLATTEIVASLRRLIRKHHTRLVTRGIDTSVVPAEPSLILPAGTEDAAAAIAILAVAAGHSGARAIALATEAGAGRPARLPKLIDRTELPLIGREAKANGGRMVFTCGCFDILHSGHISLLRRARELGTLLVVGLNSDESVARLKGVGRPINSLADRAEVLGALACVDYVVPFSEDTPIELIRLLQPGVFVKGGDYTEDALPEAALMRGLGGRVEILRYVPDHSTTGIIERIGQRQGAGAG
jgi:rfaE bifunctional protein nucleotidyltransferase chain/domain